MELTFDYIYPYMFINALKLSLFLLFVPIFEQSKSAADIFLLKIKLSFPRFTPSGKESFIPFCLTYSKKAFSFFHMSIFSFCLSNISAVSACCLASCCGPVPP